MTESLRPPEHDSFLGRLLPAGAFTRAIEELIEKDNPDNVIGWPADPVPEWARSFRPRSISDLGSGMGGETVSMLTRLGQWGCLESLQELHLFEHDNSLIDGTPHGLAGYLRERAERAIRPFVTRSVGIEVHTESLVLDACGGESFLRPLDKLSRTDLAFCSHITYFFDDGSGLRFTKALLQQHLATNGLAWMNIRDLHFGAYKARSAVLDSLGLPDPQPFDYSEHYASVVMPALEGAELLESAQVKPQLRAGADRGMAAELMMWRTTLGEETRRQYPEVRLAVDRLARDSGPLFSETQFILAKR